MGLEIVYGEPRHRAVAVQLAQVLEASVDDGTIYLGYPVLATADERVFIDALLVSAQRGVVGQSPAGWWEIECDARCVQLASAG